MLESSQRIEYGFHGLLHMYLGGVWDCGQFSVKEEVQKMPNAAKVLLALSTIMNNFWRAALGEGMLVCPDKCDEDIAFDNCRCSCPSLDARSDASRCVERKSLHASQQQNDFLHAASPPTLYCLLLLT